jgi:hypothetical protein
MRPDRVELLDVGTTVVGPAAVCCRLARCPPGGQAPRNNHQKLNTAAQFLLAAESHQTYWRSFDWSVVSAICVCDSV